MRSNRGITLTSLIIYIIVFSIVIGTVSTITGMFTSNLDYAVIESTSHEQYARFTTYLTDDLNSINLDDSVDAVTVKALDYIQIIFKDGTKHQYVFEEGNIYYKLIKEDGNIEKIILLCNDITGYGFDIVGNKLETHITMGDGITYRNNYSI